jgi:hypothetical protein
LGEHDHLQIDRGSKTQVGGEVDERSFLAGIEDDRTATSAGSSTVSGSNAEVTIRSVASSGSTVRLYAI